jgi:hypothetical protein
MLYSAVPKFGSAVHLGSRYVVGKQAKYRAFSISSGEINSTSNALVTLFDGFVYVIVKTFSFSRSSVNIVKRHVEPLYSRRR